MADAAWCTHPFAGRKDAGTGPDERAASRLTVIPPLHEYISDSPHECAKIGAAEPAFVVMSDQSEGSSGILRV
jgi:hypothetical protein